MNTRQADQNLFRHVAGACGRTGMDVLMVEDDEAVPEPPKLDPGEDPYCWGSSSQESGEGWRLRTSGDLLGKPYRIFGRSLAVRRSVWLTAMIDYARYRAVAGGQRRRLESGQWVDAPILGVPLITCTDQPLTEEQELLLVEWLFNGWVPKNWPNPLEACLHA